MTNTFSAVSPYEKKFKIESPVTAEKAQGDFQVDPGLQVELVAAEPLVVAPSALTWDEKGRLFVAENRGYPTTDQPKLGRIVLLEDQDNDGRMDRRTEFAADLTYPNGLMPWDGGLIVTCAPDVLFLKDTDGDGIADIREIWLTGFSAEGTTQLRVSHPILGPDSKVYLTSGWAPGINKVTSPKFPQRAAVEFNSNSRFDLKTLTIEPVDGRSQFGHSFDDAGNYFQCYNRVHAQHWVIPSRALQRNPGLTFSETIQNVPEALVSDLLGGANQNFAARTFPISENITTADSHLGTFSAACSVTIYRGDLFPDEYYGNLFACDPTGNLIRRDRLAPRGYSFSSRIATEGREFLASPDNWFRPVNLSIGPDGAFYICDMYRKTIEHPQYLPEEVRKHTDFVSGSNLGRLWRVSRQNSKKPSTIRLPGKLAHDWVDLLGHANVWQRETAQRLLLQQGPGDSALLVEKTLQRAKDRSPNTTLSRLLALRLLQAWDRLTPDLHRLALQDADAKVRAQAWRIAGHQPSRLNELQLTTEEIQNIATESDARARFWAVLTLGSIDSQSSLKTLAQVARRDGDDRWARAAILSSLKDKSGAFAKEILSNSGDYPVPEMMLDLGRVTAATEKPEIISSLLALALPLRTPRDYSWQIPLLSGFVEGLKSSPSKMSLTSVAAIQRLQNSLDQWGSISRDVLADAKLALSLRLAAMQLHVALADEDSKQALFSCLKPEDPADLQKSAIRLLTGLPGTSAAQELLSSSRWSGFSPTVRALLLNSLLAQPRHAASLLTALESNQISSSEIARGQRDQLLKIKDESLQARARKLFDSVGGDRMKAYQEAKAILQLPFRVVNGKAVFATQCATCHRLDREGANVGPDLMGIRDQPKESILLHVVHPNYEVAAGFTAYEVECTDGRTFTGLLSSESPTSITLKQAQGIEETLRRSEIKTLTAAKHSLMPEGLDQTVSKQDLADLIAYLKGEQ